MPASLAVALLGWILAACGSATGSSSPGAPDANGRYECAGLVITPAELATAPAVVDVDHPGLATFAAGTDRLDGWRAIVVEDERLSAIREIHPPVVEGTRSWDHERLTVAFLDASSLPGGEASRWEVISAGGCALRADLGTHTAGEIHLPSGQAINRDRSEVEVLVVEQECTGGRDAAGRVEVIIEASPDQVRLVAAVHPLDGAQPCPDNPPTPVTVNLGEPLGDRTVVDAGRYPARRLQPYVDS